LFNNSNLVSVLKTRAYYPSEKPYNPSKIYPEYPFQEKMISGENLVYEGVRNLLKLLALDTSNFNNNNWNPLKALIKPGNRVLIKPNMVKESHLTKPNDWEYVITHGSVMRAICDYIFIALKGEGEIIIADAPETDVNFDLICERNGVTEILNFYTNKKSNISIKILDLRKEQWEKKNGVIVHKWPLEGDPEGYTRVFLNENSEFMGHNCNQDYFGATFDQKETRRHHKGIVHEYLISSTVLNSDVIINIPKLKTHKKAGITCCLKNLVGINGDKNWLPHHTEGTPGKGGDQFPTDSTKSVLEYTLFGKLKELTNYCSFLSRWLSVAKKVGKVYFGETEEVIRSGNWYGNDTVWRMILDLNKILYFYDKEGNQRAYKRNTLCLVDGVLAGEGMGPLHPDCKKAGLLIAGFNPAVVDRACAKIMGYDYNKIPSIRNAFFIHTLPFAPLAVKPIIINSNQPNLCGELNGIVVDPSLSFIPHFGWKGHIELNL